MPGKRLCDYDAVAADALAGMPYPDIARKHGISEQSAGRIARKAGIRRQMPAKKALGEWDESLQEEWTAVTAFVMRGLRRHGKSR